MDLKLVIMVTLLGAVQVWGDIDCFYCGHKKLCELPFRPVNESDRISCPKACLKFDGKNDVGKRVIVRTCAPDELQTNICVEDYTYNGAKGKVCQCNAANCNSAQGHGPDHHVFWCLLALTLAFMVTLRKSLNSL